MVTRTLKIIPDVTRFTVNQRLFTEAMTI